MNMKKYTKLLVLCLVMLMAFTGCSKEKQDESENLDEEMLLIDIRETVSGLLDGEFPSIIISDNSETVEVEKGMTFAIALDENPSTAYTWVIKDSDSFELVGDGYIAIKTDELLVGSGGTHYYGIKALTKSEFKVEFDLISPSGDLEETIVFDIISK